MNWIECVLRRFCNVAGLRTLLTFDNFEFDRVALLQTLIAIGLDRAIVHEYVGAILAPDKSKALGIVEPLDRTFQSCHLQFLRTDSTAYGRAADQASTR